MKELSRQTYELSSRTTTMHGYSPWPIAYLWVAAMFLPLLLVGEVAHAADSTHWREYDQFWKDWHAKYDRYRTRNGKHKLNSISLPSEHPYNGAVCTCGFAVKNAADDGELLTAFQEHLDLNEPPVLDLAALHALPSSEEQR